MNEYRFHLPDVGEGLADAAIVRWIVPEGGAVKRMDPLVEIETAKSVTEIPSPVAGTVLRHGALEGETLEVGDVLATIATEAPADPAGPVVDESPAASAERPDALVVDAESSSAPLARRPDPVAGRRRRSAAPTVRRRAVELGIDLGDVAGTGPLGRVLMGDLDAHVTTSASNTGIDRVEKLSRLRAAVSSVMTTAWRTVPHITDLREVDASGLIAARAAFLEETGTKVGHAAIMAAAVCRALRSHPVMNASIDVEAGTVTYHGSVHLGIAISVDDGLVVAVVRNAQDLGIRELDAEIERLAALARAGRLPANESSGATFTVSSSGRFGGWYGTPIVVPPQVGIAGFGSVRDAVVAVNGAPVVRPSIAMSISADHRLVDGAALTAFSVEVGRLLENPIRILI